MLFTLASKELVSQFRNISTWSGIFLRLPGVDIDQGWIQHDLVGGCSASPGRGGGVTHQVLELC